MRGDLALRIVAVASGLATAWLLVHYPVGAGWLAAALLAYGIALWRWPSAWLLVLPALLPVLDLAPWTGWFFVDEFDLFVLVTLAVVPWRHASGSARPCVPTGALLVFGLLTVSYAVSLVIAILPLAPLDLNAFASYHSPYNGLRAGKGFLSALALAWVLARGRDAGTDVARRFIEGTLLGLAGLGVLVLRERLVFSGLFNFSNDYRITPFSVMHVGGAALDGYLVMAAPCVAAWLLLTRSAAARLAGVALFASTTYAVLVTFSRGTYAGFVVAGLVFGGGLVVHGCRAHSGRILRLAVPTGLLAVAALISVPVLKGSYIQHRFSRVAEDVRIRVGHWQAALNMADPGWRARVFGAGLGRFPATYLAKRTDVVPPETYRFETDGGNTYLRLRSGDSLYFEQAVAVRPSHDYALALDVRTRSADARLTVPICEKSLQYSFRCSWLVLELPASDGRWQHQQVRFNSGEVANGRWWARRPVKLSLHNNSYPPGTIVDVDNVRLVDGDGRDLVANGDFSSGHARWFFSVDNHLPWHLKNLWLHVLFEQGWFGLVATAAALAYAVARLTAAAWAGDVRTTALLAALAGFLTVGLVDSLIDAPRVALLFFLVLSMAGLGALEHRPASEGGPRTA